MTKRVIGLDGLEYIFSLKSLKLNDKNQSKLHKEARVVLQSLFQNTSICEEITLPGTKLRFDFYIPTRNLIVEVDGSQHTIISTYFHKHTTDFWRQLKNDKMKDEFCEINDITLIRLPFNKTLEWTSIILQGITHV